MIRRSRAIARSSTPIKRGTPPAKRRKTKKAKLVRVCDKLWAEIVKRERRCEFVGQVVGRGLHVCKGALQAMHGIPRTYRATRWLPINGTCGCQGAHWYFTMRPEEWSAWLVFAWGLPVFQELWSKARSMAKVDLDATHAALVAEAEGRKG